MVLPLIPSEDIMASFQWLEAQAPEDDRLKELFAYVKKTWIDGSLWTPASWCVYGRTIRTNNDVEGWHHR